MEVGVLGKFPVQKKKWKTNNCTNTLRTERLKTMWKIGQLYIDEIEPGFSSYCLRSDLAPVVEDLQLQHSGSCSDSLGWNELSWINKKNL